MKHSQYSELYHLIIPENHILRKIKELVDFSFIYDELKQKYCLDNGRNTKHPVLLFKYLLLKYLYCLSDYSVVERSRYDLSFKYFLDLVPEEEVIHPSLLTKFRKQRLKDQNLLTLLINKTIEIAMEQHILKSNSIIIDSTATQARYHKITKKEMIYRTTLKLKEIATEFYSDSSNLKEPNKNAPLQDTISYSKELITKIEQDTCSTIPSIQEQTELLKEMIKNNMDCFEHSFDSDARIGHKSAGLSFYGYKTHLAMSEERIITAATITSGSAFDGTQLPILVEKTKQAGMEVSEVIADTAYSTLENLKDASTNQYQLISKLNPNIIKGTRSEDNFYFNKERNTMQCPAGH